MTLGKTPCKLTVMCDPSENWEYRCNACKQLRFSAGDVEPVRCGNCGSADIVVGRPGTLPAETGEETEEP